MAARRCVPRMIVATEKDDCDCRLAATKQACSKQQARQADGQTRRRVGSLKIDVVGAAWESPPYRARFRHLSMFTPGCGSTINAFEIEGRPSVTSCLGDAKMRPAKKHRVGSVDTQDTKLASRASWVLRHVSHQGIDGNTGQWVSSAFRERNRRREAGGP